MGIDQTRVGSFIHTAQTFTGLTREIDGTTSLSTEDLESASVSNLR